MDRLQGHIVWHRKIQPLFCDDFEWYIIYKNAKSLCYTPETNVMLQLTIPQSKKLENLKKLFAFLKIQSSQKLSMVGVITTPFLQKRKLKFIKVLLVASSHIDSNIHKPSLQIKPFRNLFFWLATAELNNNSVSINTLQVN